MSSFRSVYRDLSPSRRDFEANVGRNPADELENLRAALRRQRKRFLAMAGFAGISAITALAFAAFSAGQHWTAAPGRLSHDTVPVSDLIRAEGELEEARAQNTALVFEVELLRERLSAAEERHRELETATLEARAGEATESGRLQKLRLAMRQAGEAQLASLKEEADALAEREQHWSDAGKRSTQSGAPAAVWTALDQQLAPAGELDRISEMLARDPARMEDSQWLEFIQQVDSLRAHVLSRSIQIQTALSQIEQVSQVLTRHLQEPENTTKDQPPRPEPAKHPLSGTLESTLEAPGSLPLNLYSELRP